MINKINLKVILIFSSLSFISQSFALSADQLLNEKLQKIHTLKASFIQKIENHQGKSLHQSFGHLALRRPDKFRWQVIKPTPELIIANGNKLWMYNPDLEQVVIRSFSGSDMPILLLSRSEISSNQYFSVRVLSKAPLIFDLVPRKKDSLFAHFQIEFNKDVLMRMTFIDHVGQTTHVLFKQVEQNIPLSTNLFKFMPPKGTDVIHGS